MVVESTHSIWNPYGIYWGVLSTEECNKFKRQEFGKLSEDEKEKWSEVVRLEWEEAKRILKDRDLAPRLLEHLLPFLITRVLICLYQSS